MCRIATIRANNHFIYFTKSLHNPLPNMRRKVHFFYKLDISNEILLVQYYLAKCYTQRFLEYLCFDKDPEFIPGKARKIDCVMMHLVEATCYSNKRLSCRSALQSWKGNFPSYVHQMVIIASYSYYNV